MDQSDADITVGSIWNWKVEEHPHAFYSGRSCRITSVSVNYVTYNWTDTDSSGFLFYDDFRIYFSPCPKWIKLQQIKAEFDDLLK